MTPEWACFEQYRAFKVPPQFSGFAVDQKVGYVVSALQDVTHRSAVEFSVLRGRLDSQERGLHDVISCVRSVDASMHTEEEVSQRLNSLKDTV